MRDERKDNKMKKKKNEMPLDGQLIYGAIHQEVLLTQPPAPEIKNT